MVLRELNALCGLLWIGLVINLLFFEVEDNLNKLC